MLSAVAFFAAAQAQARPPVHRGALLEEGILLVAVRGMDAQGCGSTDAYCKSSKGKCEGDCEGQWCGRRQRALLIRALKREKSKVEGKRRRLTDPYDYQSACAQSGGDLAYACVDWRRGIASND